MLYDVLCNNLTKIFITAPQTPAKSQIVSKVKAHLQLYTPLFSGKMWQTTALLMVIWSVCISSILMPVHM